MSAKRRSEVAAWLAAGVTAGILLPFAVLGPLAHYQDMIRYRHAHPLPGWQIRKGLVEHVNRPDFGYSPPLRRSVVAFTDWYGQHVTTSVVLPYRTHVGQKVEVDVHAGGSIYVPRSWDYQYSGNGRWSGPRASVSNFWPGIAITLFAVVSLLIAFIVGSMVELLGKRLWT